MMKQNYILFIAIVFLAYACKNSNSSSYGTESDDQTMVSEENWIECDECDGNGYNLEECPKCNGLGSLYDKRVVDQTASCPTCHGGITICNVCYGRPLTCNNCSGRGQIKCKECSGAGYTVTFIIDEYVRKECWNCNGNGVDVCPICSGKGQLFCEKCWGNGKIACPTCGRYGNDKITYEEITDEHTCSKCNGSGKIRLECPECEGKGKILQ